MINKNKKRGTRQDFHHRGQLLKSKRAMEMAISTLILIVLGVMVLIGLISALVLQWENLSETVSNYMGSDTQRAMDACENDCSFDKQFDFCCSEKDVEGAGKTCVDLNISCSNINCEGMC